MEKFIVNVEEMPTEIYAKDLNDAIRIAHKNIHIISLKDLKQD